MKYFAFLSLSAFALAACEGPRGPMGPPGPQGPPGSGQDEQAPQGPQGPTTSSAMSDSTVLVAFYYAMGGEYWKINTNWLSEAPISQWYGVTTNPSGRYVTWLDLSDNGLWGEIPPELGNLEYLETLDLPNNDLRGEIPSELGNFGNLEFLNLGGNDLRGEISPELGNLEYLEYLVLGGNKLRGKIPSELGNLEYLETLKLRGNSQLSGCLPEGSTVSYCTSPRNQRFAWDGNEVIVSWEPVEGATHYNVYWDGFFGSSCHLEQSGTPSWCEQLALGISETTYVHTEPDSGFLSNNYYWVTACNSDGCSEIDSENSAKSK